LVGEWVEGGRGGSGCCGGGGVNGN